MLDIETYLEIIRQIEGWQDYLVSRSDLLAYLKESKEFLQKNENELLKNGKVKDTLQVPGPLLSIQYLYPQSQKIVISFDRQPIFGLKIELINIAIGNFENLNVELKKASFFEKAKNINATLVDLFYKKDQEYAGYKVNMMSVKGPGGLSDTVESLAWLQTLLEKRLSFSTDEIAEIKANPAFDNDSSHSLLEKAYNVLGNGYLEDLVRNNFKSICQACFADGGNMVTPWEQELAIAVAKTKPSKGRQNLPDGSIKFGAWTFRDRCQIIEYDQKIIYTLSDTQAEIIALILKTNEQLITNKSIIDTLKLSGRIRDNYFKQKGAVHPIWGTLLCSTTRDDVGSQRGFLYLNFDFKPNILVSF